MLRESRWDLFKCPDEPKQLALMIWGDLQWSTISLCRFDKRQRVPEIVEERWVPMSLTEQYRIPINFFSVFRRALKIQN